MDTGEKELGEFLATQYQFVRRCGDGSWIGMHRMGYNWRLSIDLTYSGIGDNYCYDHMDVCYNAFLSFEPGRDKDPEGWKKQVETNRCRPNGDPDRESIGWPRPPM